MNKKKLIATGAILVMTSLGVLGALGAKEAIQEKQLQTNPESIAYQLVSLSVYGSGITMDYELKSDDVQLYCNFESGLEYTGWLDKEKKLIDGEYLVEELSERDIEYAIIDGEYFTENGENLVEVIAEKVYPASKVEREDGTFFYTAPYGGVLEGDKVRLTSKLYVLEQEEMKLPVGYTLVSIENIISTKPFSDLNGKDLYSEGKDGVTLK